MADQNASRDSQLLQLVVNYSTSPTDTADVPRTPPEREMTAVLEPPPTMHPQTMHDLCEGLLCAGGSVKLTRQSDCKEADTVT